MIALLLGTAPASAGIPVPVTVCVRYLTDFTDAGSTHGDDLWTSNSTAKKARGIYFELNDSVTHSGAAEFTGFADAQGCADMTLESGVAHYIRVESEFDLDGRGLSVGNGTVLYSVNSTSSITPTWGQTYNYTLNGAASGLEWVNAAAAASYTMFRRLDAWPELDYTVVLDEHPTTGGSAYDPEDGIAYIDPTGGVPDVFRKYTVAHEMGHHLLHFASWNGSGDMDDYAFSIDYDAAEDSDCDDGGTGGHAYNSKEYQGAAIIEGHADYVAAVAFNHTGSASQTNNDCRYVPAGPVQWDPDNGFPTPDAFSCEGAEGNDSGGAEYSAGVDARDYMGDYCADGATSNRGVEYDWLRFFWDADTDDGVTVFSLGDSVDLLVTSQPWAWRATDSGGGTLPRVAVEGAFTYFDSGAFEDVWDDWAVTNGVHR